MATDKNTAEEYRVLARKYRPQNFEELIGQDALVRTLRNAIETGRIAHAFMLTGVRGVGKTTTARIIAKALNYKGADGNAGATTGDTSDCKLCQAIAEDRHPDVIEMDAASRTGVDDIREILDGVRYAPTEARYKVYIIDEVHMLSKQAFNALLKTLEEPPPHVKFIFATTEIRKVPITVLSRCQRFDLRRVDVPTLAQHFANLCEKESVTAQDAALELIARAADGSVRDGLSILDQAISVSSGDITTDHVQDMLGLADRAATLDMLEHALKGETATSLDILDNYYKSGADPLVVIQDLLDLTHILTRLRAVPDMKNQANGSLSPDMMERAAQLSQTLSMPSLGKAWQILLKGLGEVQQAPHPQAAAEMLLIRLCYAANLPDPKDLVKLINDDSGAPATTTTTTPPGSAQTTSPPVTSTAMQQSAGQQQTSISNAPSGGAQAAHNLHVVPESTSPLHITSLHDVITVLESANQVVLASTVSYYAEPIKIKEGLVEIGLREGADKRIKDLQKILTHATGNRWIVTFSDPTGIMTPHEELEQQAEEERNKILALPTVKNIITLFPGAELTNIHSPEDKEN